MTMIAFNRLAGYRDEHEQAMAESYDDLWFVELPKAPPRKPDYRTSDLRVLWFVAVVAALFVGYVAGVNR